MALVLLVAVGLLGALLYLRPQGLFEKSYFDASRASSALDQQERAQQLRAQVELPGLDGEAVDVFAAIDAGRIQKHLLHLATPDRLSVRQWESIVQMDAQRPVLEACYRSADNGDDSYRRRDDAPLSALIQLAPILRRAGVPFSRHTGYDGERSACAYIRAQLNQLGLEIIEHPVDVPTPIDYGAHLTATGDSGPPAVCQLHCMMPNGARTSSLPINGIQGQLVDGGDGSLHTLKGKRIEGQIVAVDLDSRTRWENVFRLGGRAVIFRSHDNAPTNRDDTKLTHLFASANYPRFYAPDATTLESLYGREVRLFGKMRWEKREAVTLIGRVPGRDSEAGAIMITAHYDSSSVVPAASPGVDQACSAASALDLARVLVRHPPERDVLLAFFSGHHQALLGSRTLLDDWRCDDPDFFPHLSDAQRHRDHPTFKADTHLTTAWLIEHEANLAFFGQVLQDIEDDRPIQLGDDYHRRVQLAQQLSIALTGAVSERTADREATQSLLALKREAERELSAADPVRFRAMNRYLINPGRMTDHELDLPGFMRERTVQHLEQCVHEIEHIVAQLTKRRRAVQWLNRHPPALVLNLGLSSHGEHLNLQPHGFFMWGVQPPSGFHPDDPFWSPLAEAPMSWAVLTEQIDRQFTGADEKRMFGTAYEHQVSDASPAGMLGYYATEAAPFNIWNIMAVNVGSTGDFRLWHNTPFDTFARADMANLTRQARYLAAAVWKCAEETELGSTQWKQNPAYYHLSGHILSLDQRRDTVPNTPVPNAFVRMRRPVRPLAGVIGAPIAMTDYRGRFELPCILRQGRSERNNPEIAAYSVDEIGNIVRATDRAQSGTYPTALRAGSNLVEARFVTFECRAITIPDFTDPRFLVPLRELFILAAGQDITPAAWSVEKSILSAEEGGVYWGRPYARGREGCVVVAFVPPDIRAKFLGAMSTAGLAVRTFLLGTPLGSDEPPEANDEIHVTGRGFDPKTGVIPFALARAHRDLHRHVDKQITLLESCNIRSDRLTDMHRESALHLEQAEAALQRLDYPTWMDHCLSGRSLALRAYMDANGTKGDTMVGVLLFMAILLPFAFFTERLVLGLSDPVHQVIAFAVIFLLSFCTLRLVHPGFEVSRSTVVVLLGFIIFALSLFVIKLGFSKFDYLMRFVTVPEVAAHTMDISRIGALTSACFVGIGNMRRSRIRTGLTLTTVTVMTFCVLSFTSVKTTFKPDSMQVPGTADYDGITFALHSTMTESGTANQWIYDQMRDRFEPGQMVLRSGVGFGSIWDDAGFGPPAPAGITRLMGIMDEDARRSGLKRTLARWKDPRNGQEKVLGRWLDADGRDPDGTWEVLLPLSSILPQQRRRLFAPEDFFDGQTHMVRIKGAPFRVVGVFDDRAADRIRDPNGEPCSPVRSVAAIRNVTSDTQNPDSRIPTRNEHVNFRTVAITSYQHALTLDGGITRIIIGPRETRPGDQEGAAGSELADLAARITRESAVDVYLARDGDISYWRAVPLTAPHGLGNILMPLLLGSLIIFNTLLGSVQDRVSEIGIYNALGLAPPHIAGMFLAEAGVYAVLGSVLGYLVGQGVLSALTALDWTAGLSLNYSSTSAIMTMGLMILSIMLSALYPIHMVKRLCTAGAEASWKMPPADAGVIHVELPFTIDRDTASGLSRFIHEYVSGHQEASLGTGFFAEQVHRNDHPDDNGMPIYELQMAVRLAPFDMGIVQTVTLNFVYDTELEMYAIHIRVHHRAGTDWLWYRKNKEFIDSIRRQLLLWHSLEPEVRARYDAGDGQSTAHVAASPA